MNVIIKVTNKVNLRHLKYTNWTEKNIIFIQNYGKFGPNIFLLN